ncbi:MAG: glycosyltransferase [Deltaproteobacteria bacterium]|nr:glycosyltransferase [Deltaproteobacteria bacterium]
MTDAISVLLPYRNAAGTIEAALASVLGDLRADDEVIAIDDGSSDGSTAIVARLAEGDGRLRRTATGAGPDQGAGIVAALQRGLAAARPSAPWIGRMDADDVSLPGRFEAQRVLLAQAPRVAAVGVRVRLFGEHEGMARYIAWQNAIVTPEDHARELFVEAPLCHPSVLLRRSAFEEVGAFRHVPWAEDYDLWLRLDSAGYALAKVPEVLFEWRMRRDSMTRTDPVDALARFVDARAAYLAPRLAMRAGPLAIWGAGKTGRRLARALEGHGVAPAYFVDIDPKKIGRTARGKPIVDPETFFGRHLHENGAYLVVAVGGPGARAIVRERLVTRGLREGEDFVCAA